MRRTARRRLRPGVRLPVGILLILGGVFSFLPFLGLWMLPIGISIALLDLRPTWRRLRERFKRTGRKGIK